MERVAPELRRTAFTCPTCGAYAGMTWIQAQIGSSTLLPVYGAKCVACGKTSWWLEDAPLDGFGKVTRMMWPADVTAPLAHPDLPADLHADFQEARSISQASPRGAAALLRLVIEKLVIELGAQGKDINTMIGDLVSKACQFRYNRRSIACA
ncbi:TPA: DUF4145 domain-containing protein [Burkholderia vietnamiensis]|nr:DUF4145 domain-containing protein [Burkholderia vietnamiensis]